MTDCADIIISDDLVDELIVTAIDSVNLVGFADNDTGGLIAGIDAGDLVYCAYILRFQTMW